MPDIHPERSLPPSPPPNPSLLPPLPPSPLPPPHHPRRNCYTRAESGGHRDPGGVRIPRRCYHHDGNLSEESESVTGEGVGKSRRYYRTKKASKSSDRVGRTGKHMVGAAVANRHPPRSSPSPPNPLPVAPTTAPPPPHHHHRRSRRNRYTRGESGGRRDRRGERNATTTAITTVKSLGG